MAEKPKKKYAISLKTYSCPYEFIYKVYVDEKGYTRHWRDRSIIRYGFSRVFDTKKEARRVKRCWWADRGRLKQPKVKSPFLTDDGQLRSALISENDRSRDISTDKAAAG